MFHGRNYSGGIVGNIDGGSLNSSYNTGRITSNYIEETGRAGGIAGESDNCNINNTFNAGYVNSNYRYSYVGGIVGQYIPRNAGSISNSYNIGEIYSANGRYGTIYAGDSNNDSIINCYHNYNENSYVSGNGTRYLNGKFMFTSDMKERSFYNMLNVDGVWMYKGNYYPILTMGIPANINEVTELNIKNTFKTFKVTTDVKEINGVKGGNISGEDEEAYEIIPYDENNTKRIVMTPDEGYGIINITINGKEIEYEVNDDGTYTIPVGYFTNVKEDKHIVVTYTTLDQLLTINKVDKEDNSKVLPGAKFKIEQIEDRQEVTNEVGDIVANGPVYSNIEIEKEVEITGELTANGSLYATGVNLQKEITGVTGQLIDNGSYTLNEASFSESYVKIDLTNKIGIYTAVVNLKLVGEESNMYDSGYITVTKDTAQATYTDTWYYPNQGDNDYTTVLMQGGEVYYLHIGEGGYNGTVLKTTVNSIKVYECNTINLSFEKIDNSFIPNNLSLSSTTAQSYIPIDLTNRSGRVYLVVNAEQSGNGTLYATIKENAEEPENSKASFVNIATSKEANDYTTILEGGKKYYLHLVYKNNSSTSNTAKINSIKMYEEATKSYNFEQLDGKFVSNNQGQDNTVANSYIPIDLSKTKGKYNLKINAEISSQSSDYGYATITTTQNAPSYSSSTGRILRISGTQEAKDYTKVLEAGNMYYLHLGYYKNASISEGTDTFTINSIELSLNTDDFYSGEFTTNEYGQIRKEVPVGKYKITEIEAPEEYSLKEDPVEFTVETGKDNTLTIENDHLPKLIVHHYLVGTGPENGKEPVVLADDENYSGKIGEEYTTAPKMDLDPYELITDEEGNYIIPSNASGKYTEETTEVTYYYTKAPVTLIVHHYLEGTEEKLAEDEGPTRHEVGTEYETNPSEEVLESYDLVNVVGDEKGILTEDTEVIYYYKLKEHIITTRVEIPEGQLEKGGKISGEDLKPYETVKHGEDSKEELKMTPDEGYRIDKITVNKLDGDELISSEEVIFTPNDDGTYELDKFKNMTNDFEIVVQFVPNLGRVIVHHYIEGTETKIAPNEITQDKIGTVVNTKEVDTSKYDLVEESEKYVLVQAPEEKDVTIEREDKEVTYYYQAQYKITTDVIPYDERQTDGTIKSIKGGDISGEDEAPYEAVLKGKDSTKEIKAVPDKGFVITGMKINGEVYDYTKKIAEDGTVSLDKFTNMNEDKHIEVQFRRVSNVIVQYILKEPDGTTKLYKENEIPGYVGKDYETTRINITNYKASTDEEGNLVPSNKDGLMAVDTIYVKYYYEKIPAGITVKHIEKVLKKEKIEVTDEKTGETKEEIKTSFVGEPIDGVEDEYIPGYVGENKTTYRKEIEGYTNASPIEPESVIENLINAKQEEEEITVTYKENDVIEIVYWYEREYKITTDVKEHEEQVKNEETGKEETVLVKGGSITGELTNENTVPLEKVLRGRDSTKEIVIKPDYGYRIKSVILKDGENEAKEIYIKDFMQEDGKTAVIPAGYFEYMQSDKHIEVEFERIPAKVIVKYLDVVTKEELLPDKELDGFVKDPYDEPRVDIDTYIKADPEPENSKGEMTEDTITVIYYYQKQYKITTDVKEHEELAKKPLVDVVVKKEGEEDKTEDEEKDNTESEENKTEEKKIMVKGGSITGELTEENTEPVEIVTRGEDSTKLIEMKPDYGYRIKSLTIKDGEEETEIYVNSILTKEGTIVIPEGYFKDMQADKHIVVEYEPIPAKVIVNYLDKETDEKVAEQEKGDGYIDYEYKTYPKEIPYYELIKEELPENAEGKLVEKDTIVNYYYKKLLFNMKVEKEISKITLDGESVEVKDNNKAKIELEGKNVNERKLEISYIIKITNTEKVEGKAILEEHIPEGFSFVKDKSYKNWEEKNGIYVLKTKELKPGESVEYEVTLEWNASKENNGNKVNIAKIADTENIPKFEETTLEDNEDKVTVEIEVKVDMPKTGQARIIYISSLLMAGVCITIIVLNKKKNSKNKI